MVVKIKRKTRWVFKQQHMTTNLCERELDGYTKTIMAPILALIVWSNKYS